jgi:hypothetical protein
VSLLPVNLVWCRRDKALRLKNLQMR